MKTIREEATARIADLVDVGAETARLNKLHMALPRQVEELVAANARYEQLLLTSTDIGELQDAALEVVEKRKYYEARNMLSSELLNRAKLAREQARISKDISPAVVYLAAELEKLVEQVSDIDDKLGVQTATALNLTRAGVDPTLHEVLADRYFEIRNTYRHLFLSVGRHMDAKDAFERSGYLKDAFDKEEGWAISRYARDTRGAGYLPYESDYWEQVIPGPMLEFKRPPGEVFPPDVAPFEYLRWICSNSEPWVPQVRELIERHELAESLLRKPNTATALAKLRGSLAAYRGEE